MQDPLCCHHCRVDRATRFPGFLAQLDPTGFGLDRKGAQGKPEGARHTRQGRAFSGTDVRRPGGRGLGRRRSLSSPDPEDLRGWAAGVCAPHQHTRATDPLCARDRHALRERQGERRSPANVKFSRGSREGRRGGGCVESLPGEVCWARAPRAGMGKDEKGWAGTADVLMLRGGKEPASLVPPGASALSQPAPALCPLPLPLPPFREWSRPRPGLLLPQWLALPKEHRQPGTDSGGPPLGGRRAPSSGWLWVRAGATACEGGEGPSPARLSSPGHPHHRGPWETASACSQLTRAPWPARPQPLSS